MITTSKRIDRRRRTATYSRMSTVSSACVDEVCTFGCTYEVLGRVKSRMGVGSPNPTPAIGSFQRTQGSLRCAGCSRPIPLDRGFRPGSVRTAKESLARYEVSPVPPTLNGMALPRGSSTLCCPDEPDMRSVATSHLRFGRSRLEGSATTCCPSANEERREPSRREGHGSRRVHRGMPAEREHAPRSDAQPGARQHLSAGEVVHLWIRGLSGNELCGCGAAFLDCPFWSEVGRVGFGGWDQIRIEEVVALQRTRGSQSRTFPSC